MTNKLLTDRLEELIKQIERESKVVLDPNFEMEYMRCCKRLNEDYLNYFERIKKSYLNINDGTVQWGMSCEDFYD